MLPPYLAFRYACFVFFLGVFVFSIIVLPLDPFVLYLLALACIVGVILFSHHRRIFLVALLFAAFFIGSFRMSAVSRVFYEQRTAVQRLPFFTMIDGTIIAEPRIQDAQQSFILEGRIRELPAQQNVRVSINTKLAPRYHIGDRISFECKKNKNTADSAWFTSQRITAYCSHPKIAATSEDTSLPQGTITTALGSFRTRLVQIINQWIPAPHAQLIAGILVGDRTGFSRETSLLFAAVGISHIVAISGYNITVLILAVAPFVRRLRFSRILQFTILASSIALFTIFTGASSATVRAALMGGIALIGVAVGRKSGGIQTLLAAAAFMVFVDPFALFYDRGFQLSFAATAGLLILSPIVSAVVQHINDMGGLKTVAIQTLSATVGTLPILLIGFGSYSPISLVANLFVVPLIPIVMAASFIWLAIAFVVSFVPQQIALFFDPLIQFLSLPLWALSEYIFGVSRFFASLPVPKITFENNIFGIAILVAAYLFFAIMIKRAMIRMRPSVD